MVSRLFITDTAGNELFEIDPDGINTEGTRLRHLPNALFIGGPMTIFNNRLLVIDIDQDLIFEIDPDGADNQGTQLRGLPVAASGPHDLAVFNNRLLLLNNISLDLFEIDPDGNSNEGTRLRAFPPDLNGPSSMIAFENRLLVVDNIGDELFEIDPDGADDEGTRLRALLNELTTPQGMAVFEDRLLIADDAGDEIFEIDPDGDDDEGTLLRTLPGGLTSPFSMAVSDAVISVNPGDLAWEFTFSEPTVTFTPAAEHDLNPGDVAWVFTFPQPTVTLTPAAEHDLNPGDVAWEFTFPQPTVTLIPADDHAVNPGDLAWTFTFPQPTVTFTPAEVYDVNPGDVHWLFNLPEPTVSLDDGQRNVDAGDIAWSFDFPEPTVTLLDRDNKKTMSLGAPTTVTGDYLQWQNRNAPVGLADVSALSSDDNPRYLQRIRLWRSDRAGGYLYLNNKSSVPNGTNAFGTGDNLNSRWEIHPTAFTLSAPNGDYIVGGPRAAGNRVSDNNEPYSWSPPGAYADLEAWVTSYLALSNADQALVTIILDDGIRNRNAGDVDWLFDLPELTVSLDDGKRDVDAGDLDWSFSFSEPTVTLDDGKRNVDPGDLAWAFHLPQPTVTRVSVEGDLIDPGDLAWAFHFSQPTVTLISPTRHRVDAGDIAWAFNLPEPTVTLVQPRRHSIDVTDIAWAFHFPEPTITFNDGQYRVDPGDLFWNFDFSLSVITSTRIVIPNDNIHLQVSGAARLLLSDGINLLALAIVTDIVPLVIATPIIFQTPLDPSFQDLLLPSTRPMRRTREVRVGRDRRVKAAIARMPYQVLFRDDPLLADYEIIDDDPNDAQLLLNSLWAAYHAGTAHLLRCDISRSSDVSRQGGRVPVDEPSDNIMAVVPGPLPDTIRVTDIGTILELPQQGVMTIASITFDRLQYASTIRLEEYGHRSRV